MITSIDVKTGGVYVVYETENRYDDTKQLISPDGLVGVTDTSTTSTVEGMVSEDSRNQDVFHCDGESDASNADAQNDKIDDDCLTNAAFTAVAGSKTAEDRLSGTKCNSGAGDASLENDDIYALRNGNFGICSSGNTTEDSPPETSVDTLDDPAADEKSVPRFEIRKDDPYVIPEVGELVTYLYHPGQYRVGVKQTKGNRIRFFSEGNDSLLKINKKLFRNGHWRARPELAIQR